MLRINILVLKRQSQILWKATKRMLRIIILVLKRESGILLKALQGRRGNNSAIAYMGD